MAIVDTSAKITNPVRQTRYEQHLSLPEMGRVMGTTRQRVGQWESGASVPSDRAIGWLNDPRSPAWLRKMAAEILLLNTARQLAALQAQLTLAQRHLQY